MRPVLLTDLDWAVRAILAAPKSEWSGVARSLIRMATTAETHVRRTGFPHPEFGTGSIMAAAARCPRQTGAGISERDYCEALAAFLGEYINRDRRKDVDPLCSLPSGPK